MGVGVKDASVSESAGGGGREGSTAVGDTPANNGDLTNLREFLKSVKWLLDCLITSEHFLAERLREPALRAWEAEQWRIGKADEELERALAEEQHELRRQLDDAGLSGPSLSFKMIGFGGYFSRFREAVDNGYWHVANALRGKLLGWTNLILGSLSSALPILEPIKEIKEGVELGAEE